jgi:hypothetical protein
VKYLMLICGPEVDDSPEEYERLMRLIGAWVEAQPPGSIADMGQQLDRTTTARTIRAGDGAPVVTDGPFVEAKEAIGGYMVLEHDTIDKAVEAAAEWVRINPSWVIEVRPTTPD